MLHVGVRTFDFCGEIETCDALADDPVCRRLLQWRRSAEREVESSIADQLAVRDLLRAVCGSDDPLRDAEAGSRYAETLGRDAEQREPRLGRGRTDLRTATRDRCARIRATLVGCHVGVETDGFDLAHVQIELVGGNLQQRG